MKTKNVTIGILLSGFLALTFITPAFAAKPFVAKGTVVKKTSSGFVIPVSVKFRADHRAIIFSLPSFSGISSVSYQFTYNTNGRSQGAAGQITSASNPASARELLFGTCSTSVCTIHTGITGARLVFTAQLTNGKTSTRSFRIKTNF